MGRISYKDPATGKVYHESDRRLVGRGNPPTCPLPPGMGQGAMQMVVTKDDGSGEETGYREFPDTPAGATARKGRETGNDRVDPLAWEDPRSANDGNRPRSGAPQR
jgi:hypothetical protein